ncbi:hypothetical protein Xcel_2364 [Xylanimonas cellulosilytica DSM 15894]|uniref:Transcriptional regulator, AbiEi antitoxin, Type IV TA system n=1 Tax=Xylanimonas cellulosilytica (strain DSM 15894 / JCM 12276 / CECT 5975 / KCTC 9989 / LMG 20990 / NBRC 107835 / XIL07) TaxID=446471 RepID=D1BVR1_XYLCX|nr:hypothetical protein [Xylanimonas cellulosilytica]ACZ31380.1 hypothetical protein Xcel_2364 [Xylanimonas cellulosilytica DSM 15894]
MSATPPLLIARENDRSALRSALAAGRVTRVRRGAYREPGTRAEDPVHTHLRAVHAQLLAPHVFSHESAAYLWGLRLWTPPTRAHVYQRSRASGQRSADIARHHGFPRSLVELDGLPTTTRVQTVVDCLMTMRPLEGLVVADSALEAGVRRADLSAYLAGVPARNGHARAGLVVELADGGAQSEWESWLRYVAARAGLPRPTTQYRVETRLGPRDVDVAWPEHGVYLEFDGQVKYRSGDRRVLFEEKRREDAIVEVLGVRPLRVVAADARDVDALVARIVGRFPSALRSAFRPRPQLPRA